MAEMAPVPAGLSTDEIAASIARKMGLEDAPAPRDDKGRFVPQKPQAAAEEPDTETEEQTSETGEGEEPEAETEQPEEGEDQETEGQEKPQTYTVKVNGQDESVTLEELQNGYSREQAKAALSMMEQWVNASLGNNEYWQKLRAENPGEYALQRQELTEQLTGIQKRAADLKAKEDKDQAENVNKAVMTEFNKLVEAVPEWKDAAKFQSARDDMWKNAMESYGFKPQELAALFDHRAYLMMKDAAAWRALEKKKPELAPKLKDVKPSKPGNTQSVPSHSTKLNKVAARFQKSGRTDDLAEVLRQKYKL